MRKMWRQVSIWIVFISSIGFITGCWSRVEINERAFVTGLYIDKSKIQGEVEVTVGTPLSNRLVSGQASGGGSGGNAGYPYAFITKSAKTIPDALEAIQIDITRQLSWGHTRVIVVGQEYAKEGITDLVNWVSREPLFHLSNYLLVSSTKAKDVTKLTPVFEESPSEVLRHFANQHTMLATQIKDVKMADRSQQDVLTPYLISSQMEMVSEKGEISDWVGVKGGAILRNLKMVGSLNIEESQALGWVLGDLDHLIFSIKDEGASISLSNLKSTIIPEVISDELVFHFKLKAKGEIVAMHPEMRNIEALKLIKQAANDEINERFESGLSTTKLKGADVLQLGYQLEWNHPKLWDKYKDHWRDYVRNELRYTIDTDINIQYYGSEAIDHTP